MKRIFRIDVVELTEAGEQLADATKVVVEMHTMACKYAAGCTCEDFNPTMMAHPMLEAALKSSFIYGSRHRRVNVRPYCVAAIRGEKA